MRSQRISLSKAISIISQSLGQPLVESIPTSKSAGRILAQDIKARKDFPEFDLADLDGICFQAQRSGSRTNLTLLYHITPPGIPRLKLKPGECAMISTGSCLPKGANVVVPIEQTSIDRRNVRIQGYFKIGQHITPKGGYFRKGSILLGKGRLINPLVRSLIALAGYKNVEVMSKPRISIVTTGDEIVGRIGNPRPWLCSNSELLELLFEKVGCQVVRSTRVADRWDRISKVLHQSAESDLVVVTGGTGYGTKDMIRGLIDLIKADVRISGLDCLPGKRLIFALKGDLRFVFLPGKPGACFVLFCVLILPAIAEWLGCEQLLLTEQEVALDEPAECQPEFDMWCFGRINQDRVRIIGRGVGLDFLSMARSNCLVLIPKGLGRMPKGSLVSVRDLKALI